MNNKDLEDLRITEPLTGQEMAALLSAAKTVILFYEQEDDSEKVLGSHKKWITLLRSAIEKIDNARGRFQ